MAFSPSSKSLSYTGGTFSTTFTDTKTAVSWMINNTYSDVSVTITSSSSTRCVLSITAPENKGTVAKSYRISLLQTVQSNVSSPLVAYVYPFTFTVGVNYANTFFPVWKDTYFEYPDVTTLSYTIYDGDNALYSGKSVAVPNSIGVNFNVNRICSNYLNSRLPEGIKNGYYTNANYSKLFTIKNDKNNIIGQYRFHNSYLYSNDNEVVLLSQHIKDKYVIDRRQYFICSLFNRNNSNANFILKYATATNTTGTIYNGVIDNTAQSIIIEREKYKNDTNIIRLAVTTQGNIIADIEDTCYDYCLYYCNALGGWDSLLVGGNVVKTDKINSKYYTKDVDNKTTEFAKTKFMNIITPTYKIYTDWFNDNEQSRLHHLLESTEVYLHNLNTDTIEPVNITNNTCEYKTYTNNGKKKWYNTIDLEVAQEKIRK